jgi:hypothetical protein
MRAAYAARFDRNSCRRQVCLLAFTASIGFSTSRLRVELTDVFALMGREPAAGHSRLVEHKSRINERKSLPREEVRQAFEVR